MIIINFKIKLKMRKFIFTIMAFACMSIFVSCDEKSATTKVENDSTAVDSTLVDSIVADTITADSTTILK